MFNQLFENLKLLIQEKNIDASVEFLETNNSDKNRFLNIICFIGAIFFLANATISMIPDFNPNSIYHISFGLLFIFVIFLNRFIKKVYIASYILILGFFIGFTELFITGLINNYDIFGVLLMPAIAIPLVGMFQGSFFSLGLIIIVIAYNPTNAINSTLLTTFLFTTAYIISFEWIRMVSRSSEIKLQNKLESEERAHNDKVELLHELSHQIRTPLNSIMGITNLMKQDELTPDQQDYIDAINNSVMNLSSALSNMLEMVETKDPSPDLSSNAMNFNLFETIHAIVKKIQESSAISLIPTQIDLINCNLTGNPKKIETIIDDICNNILAFSNKNDCKIELAVLRKKESATAIDIHIEFKTNSLRQKNEESDNRSYQNTEKTIFQYSSLLDLLELTKVRQMIRTMGGNISHRKKDGFDIIECDLVLWKTQVHETKRTELNFSKPLSASAKELSEATILLVEDNLMNQKVLSLALEPLVKQIEIANNGKEALKFFESSRFDIILMDIQMPILDGYKTTAKIRVSEIGTNFHVPIIALTANVLNGEMEKCLAYGMDDFIGKPFEMDVLIDKMKFFLSKSY